MKDRFGTGLLSAFGRHATEQPLPPSESGDSPGAQEPVVNFSVSSGRQAMNKAKTLNLLLMGGRSFQTITAVNGQPSWIAYVGFQLLLGPK